MKLDFKTPDNAAASMRICAELVRRNDAWLHAKLDRNTGILYLKFELINKDAPPIEVVK